MIDPNPILNGPYDEPSRHYATDLNGALDYERIIEGRRIFVPELAGTPTRQGPQRSVFEINELGSEYGDHLINLLRREVGKWREEKYQASTTRVTRELLRFWFINPERGAQQSLFFAQREAIETAI